MADRPLCFVLMPFGRTPDGAAGSVDFDAVYRQVIRPAVEEAGLEPIRAGEEPVGVAATTSTFERLILSEYAVADLITTDANVFYALGVRHALRRSCTVLVLAEGGRPPLDPDLDLSPVLRYRLDAAGGPVDLEATRAALVQELVVAQGSHADSPMSTLVEDLPPPDIARLKTDVFRDEVAYSDDMKGRLATAREAGLDELQAVEAELEPVAVADAAVVIDLFLSYRAVKAWPAMIDLVGRMSAPLAATVMVREQLALALNRLGRRDEAEQVLTDLIARRGPNSETCSLLGRVYKDAVSDADAAGDETTARHQLDRAIAAYLQGFESDWRDAYPGINAVTLMELREPPDPRQHHLLPVVRYAAERRLAAGTSDYWDHATLLELAVLARDHDAAAEALDTALGAVREPWEPESTANNLALIRRARERRGEADTWAKEIEDTLLRRAG